MELAQLTCFSSRSPTGPYLAIVNQPNDGDQRTFQKPVTVRCENASALPTRDIVCFAQLFLCGQSRKDATVDSDSSLAYFSPPLEIASSLGGVASIPVSANHPICEFSDLKVHMTTSQMRKRCKFGLRRARESTRTHARARAHTHTHTQRRKHARTHARTGACTHAHTDACTHAHTDACTFTIAHTHTARTQDQLADPCALVLAGRPWIGADRWGVGLSGTPS